MGYDAGRGARGAGPVNDAEREELHSRLRKMNADSSGDKSGKRGEVGPWLLACICWAVIVAVLVYGLLVARPSHY